MRNSCVCVSVLNNRDELCTPLCSLIDNFRCVWMSMCVFLALWIMIILRNLVAYLDFCVPFSVQRAVGTDAWQADSVNVLTNSEYTKMV